MKFDEFDKILIPILCKDIPQELYPFQALAKETGIDESIIIEKIKSYRKNGKMRRFGAILNHQRAGFSGNALSVWNIGDDQVDQIAKKIAELTQVSHCFIRQRGPGWDYNLFVMLHSSNKKGCVDIVENISKQYNIVDYKILFSLREFKKTSMVYHV